MQWAPCVLKNKENWIHVFLEIDATVQLTITRLREKMFYSRLHIATSTSSQNCRQHSKRGRRESKSFCFLIFFSLSPFVLHNPYLGMAASKERLQCWNKGSNKTWLNLKYCSQSSLARLSSLCKLILSLWLLGKIYVLQKK